MSSPRRRARTRRGHPHPGPLPKGEGGDTYGPLPEATGGWIDVVPLAAILVATAAGGCDFRDEPVRPAAGATTVWPQVPPRDTNAVECIEGYEAAVHRAAGEGRPLLLVFGARWCRWSGELAGGPLADRDMVARTRRFVCGLVDADRDAATCRAYGVTAFPTVVVIDSAGAERFRAAGPDIASGLAAALDGVPDPTPPRRLAEDGPPNGPARDVTR